MYTGGYFFPGHSLYRIHAAQTGVNRSTCVNWVWSRRRCSTLPGDSTGSAANVEVENEGVENAGGRRML